jgi:hypothetical protein
MEKPANGSWTVKKKGATVGVLRADSTVVAVLPQKEGEDTRIKEAYLFAASPLLFEACCRISALLENSLIVTPEGLRINCSDVRKSLSHALARARGYRKGPEEP